MTSCGGEAHAEPQSTRSIALLSASSAAPRDQLVDAGPKAWHDGVSAASPAAGTSQPTINAGDDRKAEPRFTNDHSKHSVAPYAGAFALVLAFCQSASRARAPLVVRSIAWSWLARLAVSSMT